MKLAQAQQQTERHEEDLRAANRRGAAQGRVAALLEAEVARAKAGLAAVQQCTLEHASAGGLLPTADKNSPQQARSLQICHIAVCICD